MRIAPGEERTGRPRRSSPSASSVARSSGTSRKFVQDASGSSPSERRPFASRSRSAIVGRDVRWARLERRERECGGKRRDGSGLLPRVQVGRDVRSRKAVADARRREPERLRERPHDDHVVIEKRHGGLAARVLEVRLVHDERARGGQIDERAARIVRPADERQHRIDRRRPPRPRPTSRPDRPGTSART